MSKNKAYFERKKLNKKAKKRHAIFYARQLTLIPTMPSISESAYSMTGEKKVRQAFEQYYITLAVESGAQTKDRDKLIEIGQTIERAA